MKRNVVNGFLQDLTQIFYQILSVLPVVWLELNNNIINALAPTCIACIVKVTHLIFIKSKAVSDKSCVENFIANCHHVQKYKIEIPTKCTI